jgi:fatty acid desaturase
VWINTTGTYGYKFAYALVAVASLIVLRGMGKATPLVWLTTALSVIGMAYVFYANVFPVPAFSFNVLPWIFLGLVLQAVIRYVHLRRNRPDVIARIGNTETETLGGIG